MKISLESLYFEKFDWMGILCSRGSNISIILCVYMKTLPPIAIWIFFRFPFNSYIWLNNNFSATSTYVFWIKLNGVTNLELCNLVFVELRGHLSFFKVSPKVSAMFLQSSVLPNLGDVKYWSCLANQSTD